MASLRDLLTHDINFNDEKECKILHCIWPDLDPKKSTARWQPYCLYLKTQCGLALKDQGKHVLIRTPEHIAAVRSLLAEHITREELSTRLRSLLPTNKPCDLIVIENTIDLIARLCLMINIRSCEFSVARQTPLRWDQGSLQPFLSAHFEKHELAHQNISLDRQFIADNLVKIAGFEIEWTDNLVDHLRIIDETGLKVLIFKNIFFLKQTNL